MTDIEREVSATAADYLCALARAFPGATEVRADGARIEDSVAAMDIELAALPERRIAALTLPRLCVRIRFLSGSPAQCQALLARFDRALQRGGG